MGEREDSIRTAIERKYGSIPKMALEIGLPKNTIYHALDRGIDNTTTKTRRAILEPLFGAQSVEYYSLSTSDGQQSEHEISADEAELMDIWHALDEHGRAVLLSTARALARR